MPVSGAKDQITKVVDLLRQSYEIAYNHRKRRD